MTFGPCAEHNPAPPYNRTARAKGERCGTCKRIEIEGKIARKAVKLFLGAGYSLGVYDSEVVTLRHCRDAAQVEEALFTTDDDKLLIYRPGAEKAFGWIWFVYGNGGWDVIADYSTTLPEDLMDELNAYAETLEN